MWVMLCACVLATVRVRSKIAASKILLLHVLKSQELNKKILIIVAHQHECRICLVVSTTISL